MPRKVWFHMWAYNTEQYIRQALDSLLNQTDPDWAIWINDNGSTDRTGEICDEYAAKDERIICYHFKVNNQHTEEERIGAQALLEKYNILSTTYAEYVAVLDSDDYYHHDFVKIMYDAAKKNDADMVVAGTTMFMDDNPKLGQRRIPPDIIVRNHEISEQDFINLYASLRPYWGKLYSMDIWIEKDKIAPHTGAISNGLDTYQVLKLLNHCVHTVACVAKPLHYYRIRKTSDYHRIIDIKRYKEGKILYDVGVETAKTYQIYTASVRSFLYAVYFAHVRDLMDLVVSSPIMTPAEKIEFISYPLSEELFYQCANNFHLDTMRLLDQALQKVLENLDALERAKLKRYFLVRLFDAPKETNNNKDKMIWFFSVLCDPDNKYHWGSDKFPNINSTKIKEVIESINAPLSNSHIIAKKELLQAIDSGNSELALENFNFLTSSIPLDTDTLYFEMYLNLLLGNYVKAVETAEIARVFCRDNEEVGSMIQMVYKIVDEKEDKANDGF